MKHLFEVHDIDKHGLVPEIQWGANATGERKSIGIPLLTPVFKLLLTMWMVVAQVSFSQVECEEFRELIFSRNPWGERIFLCFHNTIRSWVSEVFHQKTRMKEALKR